jgi:TPP-dependent pyruvate/acetoin dehydrogenase alpha subunit
MASPDTGQRVWMYRLMTQAKMFEERLAMLMMSGQLETFYLAQRGQEASSAALGACLRPEDATVTTYRGLADQLAKGVDLADILAEIFGRDTGICKGRGGAMHYMDWKVRTFATGVVGGGIPVSIGLAFAARYRGSDAIAACVFGDGATDHGTFHEALNCASLWSLPAVFLCQNNLYGEATPQRDHQKKVNIAERAAAYDMPGVTVDGNDPDAAYDVLSEAVARARSGGGPTLVEAKTYRLMGHFIGDPMVYMPADEVADARTADPVPRYRQRLIDEGVLSEGDAAAFEEDVARRLDDAVEKAKAAPYPELDTITHYVYADNAYS